MNIFRNFKQKDSEGRCTLEWHQARRGKITSSNMKRILTPGGKLSKQADDYIDELVSHHFSPLLPDHAESYTSRAMAFGAKAEEEARHYFVAVTGLEVEEVGGCLSDCGRVWASVDGLVSDGGSLEIKCCEPATHIGYLRNGAVLPQEHAPQCHAGLVVGFTHGYFLSYALGCPPLLVKVEPSPYTKEMRVAIEIFWQNYLEALTKVKGMMQ